ncbi:MAG TPA: hypothetical protein VGL66_06575 [Caulobacteraceae bacterium]|jgi:hypothetical protein
MRLAFVLPLLLAGCASAPTPSPATVLCPVQPVAYTIDDEHALKAEFDALPATSQLRRWLLDYIAERAALRACATP